MGPTYNTINHATKQLIFINCFLTATHLRTKELVVERNSLEDPRKKGSVGDMFDKDKIG